MPRWLVWILVVGGATWAMEETTPTDPLDQEAINAVINKMLNNLIKKVGGKNITQGPHLRHSMTTPITRLEGEDVLITCVARNLGESSVIFKYSPARFPENVPRQVLALTANAERITSDKRFSVLHEPGGDVYVMVLKNASVTDSGMYICELNTDPVERSFHKVTVLPKHLPKPSTPPTTTSNTSSSVPGVPGVPGMPGVQDSQSAWGYSTESPITHDYRSCCERNNVSTQCQPFCSLKNILDGATGVDPSNCEAEFPAIVSCMADGRDHMDCCSRVGIPDVCTDLCRGEYTTVTDNVKTHFSCAAYTAPTLTCISVGIELLPGKPKNFAVEALNETAIKVNWSPATSGHENTVVYYINTTFVQYLNPVFSASVDKAKTESIRDFESTLINSVHTDNYQDLPTSDIIVDLKPFSLYEVSMWAENGAKGKSLKTYTVKVVTHIVGESSSTGPLVTPEIPDVKSCCIEKNVSHAPCIDKFCDARGIGSVQVSDLMICAPWDTEMFHCLADGTDHTPCCASRNIPALCQNLCSGNVTDINFKYFRCLSYMDEMASCMLEGYGVLPSAPVNFRFSNIDTSFGILHWDAPARLGDSVVDYRVSIAPVTLFSANFRRKMRTISHAKSPFILEGLQSSTTYEVFVEPVNEHGIGEGSNKIVFRTAERDLDQILEDKHPYNQTQCCIKSGVKPECQILCSYNARMSDIKALSTVCASSLTAVTRCAAGGRDHLPCCARRGVPSNCQPLCQAVHQASTGADFTSCLPFIGQIYTCYEEGTLKLPPAVRELRAVTVEDERVVLAWVSEDVNGTFETTDFQVYYKKLEPNATSGTVFDHDKELNVTVPRADITGLETGFQYRFFVVSRNEYGTSLPSAIVTATVSASAWSGSPVQGATSPPHLLEVVTHSATFLELAWNPPAITHPEDQIKYRIFYRQLSSSPPTQDHLETELTSLRLSGLNPNTQYTIYATAVVSKNGSLLHSQPSETLLAWTDPAFPAFVEAPTIHPINMVSEGSSMTVLCIAMGTPKPTVTLYIAGHPIHSDVTRHMVTVIHNVTREMGDVSCYADNGYGTPMQASRRITISRSPTVSGPPSSTVALSNTVMLKCLVDAYPAPTITVFRDRQFTKSVGNSDRISLVATGSSQDAAAYTLEMTVTNLVKEDAGTYFCHANNSLGEAFAPMQLNVTTIPPAVMNVTSCCMAQNVSSSCLDICTFSIDFDEILRKPQCVPEFHKLMSCASDGSDHRHCCSKSGVPGQCLDWCRGEPVTESEVCAVSNAKAIVGCFHEGRRHLPGPPRNIRVRPIDSTSVTVTWDLPEKNPETVELYRVFWRKVGEKKADKNDTSDTKLRIGQLVSGKAYELVVKAGNSNGTSQLTTPLKFLTADEFIITSPSTKTDIGGAVAIVLAVFLVIGVILIVVFVMKKKNLILLSVKKPESPTVAFENPFYAREPQANPQILQEDYNVRISSSGSWNSEMSGGTTNTQEPQDTQHNTTQDNIESEADPSFYEEMKLGRGGQGFKRLR